MIVMIVMIKGREKRMDDVFISPMNNEVDRTIILMILIMMMCIRIRRMIQHDTT